MMTWANLENSLRGVLTTFILFHQHISQRVVGTSPEKQLDTRDSIASQGGS